VGREKNAAALRPWIAAAPFLHLFDAWFTARGKFACHGAAIAKHGRAALIIGPGGAGKSTLALHAAREGFGYIGDDYVLLEPGPPAPVVHSIYSSGKLAVADVAAGASSRLSVVRQADDELDKAVLRVTALTVLHAAPVAVVVSPRIDAAGQGSIEPISPAEALRILLPSALQQLPGDHQAKLDILKRVLTVPCVRLNLTPSHQCNLAMIDNLLAGLASPDGMAA
jgi:hypothetical protein